MKPMSFAMACLIRKTKQALFSDFIIQQSHDVSANAHPIGTDHQIPTTPISGIADNIYARATRVPSEKR